MARSSSFSFSPVGRARGYWNRGTPGASRQKERCIFRKDWPTAQYFERLTSEAIFKNPRVPPAFKQAYGVLKDLLPHTLYRPVTPVGQFLWNQHVQAYKFAVRHKFAVTADQSGGDEIKLAVPGRPETGPGAA